MTQVIDKIESNHQIRPLFSDLKFKPFSGPIPEQVARKAHLEYLQSPYAIKDHNNQVVHSLKIDRGDLEIIYRLGTGGARIYFCLDMDSSTGKKFLSLIMVPSDADGFNVLSDPQLNSSAVINKLDPCPTQCISDPNTNNHESDLNFDAFEAYELELWFKPNYGTKGAWVDKQNRAIKPIS